jgi:hypothetical protein
MNTNVLILIAAVVISTLVYLIALSGFGVNSPTETMPAISKSRVAYNCMSDSDCEEKGFTGTYYCVNNSLFGDYEAYTCLDKGDAGSDCVRMLSKEFVKKCTDFEECKSVLGDCMLKPTTIVTTLPVLRTTSPSGISSLRSSTTTLTDVKCYKNDQCWLNYSYSLYCSPEGHGLRDYYYYECINPGTYASKCVRQEISYLMEYCGYGEYCENGECIINYSVHFTPWKYPPRYNNTRFS